MEKILTLFKNKQVRALFISAMIIVAGSWFRAFVAGTIMVDGHGLTGLPVYIVFVSFIAALTFYGISLYKLWTNNTLTTSEIKITAYILATIFSLMLPMLSNDIFSLLAYGDAANRGIDVYTDTTSLSVSPFYPYVSDLWKTAPCVYGPICLSTSRVAGWLGHGNIFVALAAYKLLALLWAVFFIEIMYALSQKLTASPRSLLFILLNPVFLLQGLAQLHCDALAITFCGAMLYLFHSQRWYLAFIFAGLAIGSKISFVLMLPFLTIALFLQKENISTFLLRAAGGVCITAITLILLYAPFYTSPLTFQKPFKFVYGQDPAKSIAEVVGDIVYFAPSVISGSENKELHDNLHVKPSTSTKQLDAWLLVKKISQLFALLMSAFVFLIFWLSPRDSRQWMKVFARLVLLFLLFYSHVFYAWYLMMVIPFLWYEDDLKFMQWIFVLTFFANVHDVMCTVQRGTPVYFLVLPLTFLSIVSFVWRLPRVYFRSLAATAGE